MNNGYPTDQELKTIENWEYTDFLSLMEYVKNLWEYPQYWKESQTDNNTKYEISTGGWSGNESIIVAMESNSMFWTICWLSSCRGGHYEFQVKNTSKKAMDKDLQTEVGNWGNKTFGKGQTTVGIINHLIKETYELRDSNKPEEAADCLLLLFQHAHECGYDLLEAARKKHVINLARKWGKPDEYGVIEHIKEKNNG